jgi:RNA polymerase sigma factor (sigma-70 family)
MDVMASGSSSGLDLVQLRRLFTGGLLVGLTDAQLLERFVAGPGEDGKAAFEFLVERHGPMVLRVCIQALKDRHQAEDAFQATFLVLARQASSIRNRDSVGSWLFGVARRAARRIRMDEARRRQHERLSRARAPGPWSHEPESTEHWPELHAAIERLPAKYREPIVLCYLEGLTHEQAASQLRWPVGTVKTRLARARERLRRRLSGLDRSCPATLPQALLSLATTAAMRDAARLGAAGAVSSAVTAITEGILKMMWIDRMRLTVITMVAVIAAAGLGAPFFAQQISENGRASVESGAPVQAGHTPGALQVLPVNATTDIDPDSLTIVRSPFDSRVDKVFVDLGSAVKRGDPLLELFSSDLVEVKNDFETASSQHARDKKVLDYKAPLAATNAIPRKDLIEAENDEAKSGIAMKVARDKLLILGLTDEEIAKVANEDAFKKAKMILRSRADGIVIKRSVVQGNYYSAKDELMQIAPLDRLWVRGRVSEKVGGKITLGQNVQVVASFTNEVFHGKLEWIDNQIDPVTHTLRIRTSIRNPDRRLKAGMFVSMLLELPPTPFPVAEPRPKANKTPGSSIHERLQSLKPKLDLLLDARADRTATSTFEAHLRALEQELELLVKEAAGR